MRAPNTPAPRTGPLPPRCRQHSRKCRTPHTPKASERAAVALPFAAPQDRRQGSQRLRTGPSGPASGCRRNDPRCSAASSRRLIRPKKGSLPPHCLHRRLLRSRGFLLPHGAALHTLHRRCLLTFFAFALLRLAFFSSFFIALRIALRIAFATSTEGGGTRAAVCRVLLFPGLDA